MADDSEATQYMAYKFRLYPNDVQIEQIHRTFGATRFIYNQMLAMQTARRKNNPEAMYVSKYKMSVLLTTMKHEKGYEWLKTIDRTALNSSCVHLDLAFQAFFRRPDRKTYPKKHKRKSGGSYTTVANSHGDTRSIRFINVDGHYVIKLPKLNTVSIKGSRIPQCEVQQATISEDSSGRFYVSVLIKRTDNVDNVPLRPASERAGNASVTLTGKQVGIDINIPHLDFSDDRTPIDLDTLETDNEAKHLHLWERRMAHRRTIAKQKQQQLDHQSTQKLGINSDWKWWQSKGYREAKQHVAKLKATQAHRRDLFFQRLTTQLIQEYDLIVVEDLKVSKMNKNSRYAKHLAEISPNRFITMLEYKTQWHAGKQVIRVDPKNTTQTCYDCGFVMGTDGTERLAISDREWACPQCGADHIRDKNAAKNILKRGLEGSNKEG